MSQGNTHILTMVDRTTRWLEAVPIASTSARSCAEAFCSSWIARFGVPDTLTTDRGAQVTSSLWNELSKLLNISHISTTAFHPQSNGMVERFHRRLKAALIARCSSPDWVAHLPWVLLSLRVTPHEKSALSPAEAVFGSALILPSQFSSTPEDAQSAFLTNLSHCLSGSLQTSVKSSVSPSIPSALAEAEFVFVKSPPSHPSLSPPYSGPFKIVKKSPHAFLLQKGPHTDSVSVHRLKPAHMGPLDHSAQPPIRGRPPKVLHSILKPLKAAPAAVKCPPKSNKHVLFETKSLFPRAHRLPSRFVDFSMS
jgi:hypothetical protein